MRRWLSSISALLLVLMVWTGTAHAAETFRCIEVSSESTGHFDGDRDEVPADADKAVPHHHGGCNGHHVAVADESASAGSAFMDRAALALPLHDASPSAEPEAALRPPIA